MKRTLILLIQVLIIITSLIAGTMATYTKTLEPLNGTVTSKLFYIGTSRTVFPNIKLAPTEEAIWDFKVINHKNNIPTEVDMDLIMDLYLSNRPDKEEIEGLTVALFEGDTQLGETIVRSGSAHIEIPRAFLGNIASERSFYIRVYWDDSLTTDETDTLNADNQNTSVLSLTITGRQSINSQSSEPSGSSSDNPPVSSSEPTSSEPASSEPSDNNISAEFTATPVNSYYYDFVLRIDNNSNQDISNWVLEFDYDGNMHTVWAEGSSISLSQSSGRFIIKPMNQWQAANTIPANSSLIIYGNGSNLGSQITNAEFHGQNIEINVHINE